MTFDDGVTARDIPDAEWLKASASFGEGNCVEVASLPGGAVAVRNSRHPDGSALVFTREEFTAFLCGAKGEEFDQLVT